MQNKNNYKINHSEFETYFSKHRSMTDEGMKNEGSEQETTHMLKKHLHIYIYKI